MATQDATPLWLQALGFGLLSALSLPVGAVLGIALSPISEGVTARWMAFGSGALVFAVATELYGKELFLAIIYASREHGRCVGHCRDLFVEVTIQNVAGLVGSILYVLLNRWLQKVARQEGSRTRGLPALRPAGPSAVEVTTQSVPFADTRSSVPMSSFRRIEEEPSLSSTHMSPVSFHGSTIEVAHGSNTALSMWLGLVMDGIPEALMLGFMTNSHEITLVFIAAIFVANFPEAFSGASMLKAQGMSACRIMVMWSAVFVLTGVLAAVGSAAMPANTSPPIAKQRGRITACLEGLTGGAMLAMVATAMLPEAFKGAREMAGILFVLGFVSSVFLAAFGAYYGGIMQKVAWETS